MTRRRHSRVAPTRHELIKIKDELQIARKGEHVLERRRDGLIFAFLDLLDRWKALRVEADETFAEATSLHVLGEEREGEIALRALSESRPVHAKIVVTETKLLGLTVPLFLSSPLSTTVSERGYGFLGSSALDDEIVTSYELLLSYVVRLAEMKAVIFRLLAEIYRLRIRVNYLTYRLIPELEAEKRYIQQYIDEREQEERYRQFRVKRRREQRERASRRGE